MTDITKCNNETCESNQQCWRYLAPASEYQSYAAFVPEACLDRCEYFIKASEWQKLNKNDKYLNKTD